MVICVLKRARHVYQRLVRDSFIGQMLYNQVSFYRLVAQLASRLRPARKFPVVFAKKKVKIDKNFHFVSRVITYIRMVTKKHIWCCGAEWFPSWSSLLSIYHMNVVKILFHTDLPKNTSNGSFWRKRYKNGLAEESVVRSQISADLWVRRWSVKIAYGPINKGMVRKGCTDLPKTWRRGKSP